METATQSHICKVGACSERVPSGLGPQAMCLTHYLDQAFTRISSALHACSRGERLDPQTQAWLRNQGDFAVQLLTGGGASLIADQRTRLLELLLCLANAQEYVRKHAKV